MGDLSKPEYEALLQVAQAALGTDRPQEWWEVAADMVRGPLLNADVFSLNHVDLGEMRGRFVMIRPSWAESVFPSGAEMPPEPMMDHPFSPILARPALMGATRISDVVSSAAWRRTAAYAATQELLGDATNQLGMSIEVASEERLHVEVLRAGSDFTDHEVAVANRLQPLLRAAGRHHDAIRQWRRDSDDPTANAAAEFRLTRRQHLILAMMAEGLSTAAIAHLLAVSARTVSKHQEHIYRKLKVSNRLAAVYRAQQAGVIRSPSI